MNDAERRDGYDYRNHTIYYQAECDRPWKVSWLRPDGLSVEPRGFKTRGNAEAWVDDMLALSPGG